MRSGVLLMAHGTPSSLDDMPEYLRLVRGGRPPSPELVAEMRHNYEAIGGRSPLTTITETQADGPRRRLGADVPVVVGMRNWRPVIQGAGRTPAPWIGLHRARLISGRTARGARRFLVVPIGFVCDHTEILFDIDVQAVAVARE